MSSISNLPAFGSYCAQSPHLALLVKKVGKYRILEGTARYAGLLLAPAEGFGLWPRPWWPSANPCLAFGQSLESKFIPWVQVNTMSPMEYIQFLIWKNTISQWIKYNFTLKQIKFYIGKNSITHWNKSNLTLKQVQLPFGTNPTSGWKNFE